MKNQYCVIIQNGSVRHEFDTVSVLLDADKTLSPLREFDSIDAAVAAAQEAKNEHPNQVYEVHQYFGTNTNFKDIEERGRWNISREVLRII